MNTEKESKITAYCGYCGAVIIEMQFHPYLAMPRVTVLHGYLTCARCEEKAHEFLLSFPKETE